METIKIVSYKYHAELRKYKKCLMELLVLNIINYWIAKLCILFIIKKYLNH